ncbi:hypothetical protein Cde04nite_00750 [Cellulomonas denverensis]|nr:hypothetical protein Cde04nite_00750 [Cellulomonas denverensis]
MRLMPDADQFLSALLATQGDRMVSAEDLCRAAVRLAHAQGELEEAERAYRRARESAEAAGWVPADLDRAGLPRVAAWVDTSPTPPPATAVYDTHVYDTPLYGSAGHESSTYDALTAEQPDDPARLHAYLPR